MAPCRIDGGPPCFAVSVPRTGYVPCREPAAAAALAEGVGAFVADSAVDDVAVVERVSCVSEESDAAFALVGQSIIVGVFFLTAFECLICVCGNFTH